MTFAALKLDQGSLNNVFAALKLADEKIAKKSLRKGVRRAAKIVLGAARSRAPVGKTRLLRRSMGMKTRSYPRSNKYLAFVGQKEDRRGMQRAFPTKTRAAARRRNWGLSTGISGTGRVVPIHLVELATKPHRIPVSGSTLMAMIPRSVATGKRSKSKTRPGKLSDIQFMSSVRHPGKEAVMFLEKAARSSERPANSAIRAEVVAGIKSLREK